MNTEKRRRRQRRIKARCSESKTTEKGGDKERKPEYEVNKEKIKMDTKMAFS